MRILTASQTILQDLLPGREGTSTYLSHPIADPRCPIKLQFSAIESYPTQVIDNRDYVAPGNKTKELFNKNQLNLSLHLIHSEKFNHMKHVPVQILSATDTVGLPIYIEIDSAATCSYIIL